MNKTKDVFETGRKCQEAGDHAGAIIAFSKALSVDPLRSEAYRLRAISKAILKDALGSEADFANAIETTTLDEACAMIHADRGAARLQRGELVHARVDFVRALEIDPKNMRARELIERTGPAGDDPDDSEAN